MSAEDPSDVAQENADSEVPPSSGEPPLPPTPASEPVASAPEVPRAPEAPASEPAAKHDSDRAEHKRGRFENILPGLIRRGIEKSIEAGISTFEKSVETGRETTDAVREKLQDVKIPKDVANAVGKALTEAKLPRDIASAVFTQLDDTKNDVLRILAREFREFLEATDLSTEIKNALTSLSFEVRTEVRFIPNDAGSGVKADVRARTRVKRASRERPRRRKSRREAELDDDELDPDDDDS